MPDQNDLLKAIRVIVKEEIQPVTDDVIQLKQETRDRFNTLEERFTTLEGKVERLEKKVDTMPEQLMEMIVTPLVQEDEYQDQRLARLEEQSHLAPLPRPKEPASTF